MEILSPVGSPDSLAAAIKAGADAVYLAGKDFGARAFAGNFTDRQLEGAVGYAHDHGVKVHVTVNTSIKNSEMEVAVSLVRFLADIGADAVIVQDLGLLKHIESVEIDKHASTQMQIHSLEGLKWCAENGISRAVLARELTMEELSAIVPDSPIETEVFIQGALCYCMSGGCLLSSFMGGRSGNRGSCAQPCRKMYDNGSRNGYLMSSADLYGLEYMDDLRKLGVDSLKIEGRMRSPAYAYLSTRAYVKAEKGEFDEEFDETLSLLKTVFNRGTCDGYLGGVKSTVQSLYPDNRGFLLGEAEIVKGRIDTSTFIDTVGIRDGLSIYNGDMKMGGFKIMELDPIHVPFKIPDGRYQIYRTYDPRIDVIKNFIGETPVLDGNTMRRTVRIPFVRHELVDQRPQLSFYLNTLKGLEAALPYADRVYFDNLDRIDEAREVCSNHSIECVTLLPRFDPRDEYYDNKNPVMINNPAQYSLCKGAKRIYGSSVLNTYNSSIPLDLHQVTLSVELSRTEVSDMVSKYPGRTEVMVFGRTELMISRDPDMENGMLKDVMEMSFPAYRDRQGCVRILNSVDLCLFDNFRELTRSGVVSMGLDLRKRPPELVKTVGEMCTSPTPHLREKFTEMCGGNFTKGLYFRGV